MLFRIRHRLILTVTTCVFLASLSGCGFALRGTVDLPAQLDSVLVTGSDREATSLLKRALRGSGAVIVDSDDDATAVLNLVNSEFTRDVRTTDANGRATAFTLRYKVDYDLRESNGEEIQINQSLSQSRFLAYDPLLELQSEEEAEFLEEEMQEEIILQILRRLSRI